ncbi:MAG: hypothetical protein DWP97_09665 [Calditrichaeota bacterium]|nr:MAG: hypothetical protein DWP97_09665 [Calditrichota bacterium]
MNNCEYFQKILSDANDDNMLEHLDKPVTQHMKTCKDCAEFLSFMQHINTGIRSLPEDLTKQKESKLSRIWNLKISIPLPAAAVLALILLGFIYYQNDQSQIRPEINKKNQQIAEFVKFEPKSAVLIDNSTN